MELVTTSPKVQERIYIGGLNPPRLSARDIIRRLKSLDQIEIESSSIVDNGNDEDDESEDDYIYGDNKPYLHITAISKDESCSALSIIHKHYHNVKWKGCKLVVELAKPHFLERLEQERLHREKSSQEMETVAVNDQKENTSEEPSRIPRRLRVRKKHGDTAVHIDTKPWTVETWSRFNKARTKLKEREVKHGSFSSPAPLMHRAVHIRFLKENNSSVNLNGKVDPSENNINVGGTMISSSGSLSGSLSSASESESSHDDIIDKDRESSTRLTSERYEWSDDDSYSQNPKENINGNVRGSNVSTEIISLNQEPNNVTNISVEQDRKNETYHWSTDEESLENDQGKKNPSFLSRDDLQLTPGKFSGDHESVASEDASTFDHNEDKNFGVNEISNSYNREEDAKMEADLIGDVATNLNILSSIFPEMVNTRPMNPESEDTSKLDNKKTTSSSDAKKNIPNPVYGIMPRYDPTAKSSRKYIVENEQIEQNEAADSMNNLSSEETPDKDAKDEDESKNIDNAKTQNETHVKSPPVSTIYEQDKLENVFRDARDAWGVEEAHATVPGTSTKNTKNTNQESPSEKKSFSFGFSLNDNESGNVNNKQIDEINSPKDTFSFSFSVNDQDQKEVKRIPAINDNSTTEQRDPTNVKTEALSSSTQNSKATNDSAGEEVADDVVKRHKGLTVTDQDLQKYVENFFGCNNGIRIMQNPQEFMNDDNQRAEWNNERNTLTLDWKRKRKYAITRIQKRMKVQRR